MEEFLLKLAQEGITFNFYTSLATDEHELSVTPVLCLDGVEQDDLGTFLLSRKNQMYLEIVRCGRREYRLKKNLPLNAMESFLFEIQEKIFNTTNYIQKNIEVVENVELVEKYQCLGYTDITNEIGDNVTSDIYIGVDHCKKIFAIFDKTGKVNLFTQHRIKNQLYQW